MRRTPYLPPTPTPRSPPGRASAAGKGLSGPAGVAGSDDDLLLPHERDQAHGQVASEPDPVIEQAGKDLQSGQVDTDLRATPGLDAARRARLLSPPAPQGVASGSALPDQRRSRPSRRK